MEDNYNSRAIVIDSKAYREGDILVSFYTQKFGRLSLIAKGAKKLSSKMAGHLEPLTLIKLMIIKGRGLDYVGGVATEKSFLGIKSDLNKLFYTGKIVSLFSSLIKDKEADNRLFSLLTRYLETIEEEDDFSKEIGELLWLKFSLSFLKESGYCPEMNNCLNCKKKLEKGLKMDFKPVGHAIFISILINWQIMRYSVNSLQHFKPDRIFCASRQIIMPRPVDCPMREAVSGMSERRADGKMLGRRIHKRSAVQDAARLRAFRNLDNSSL